MISFLGFLQHVEIFLEFLLLRECNGIETSHLLTFLIPSPVSTCQAHYLDGFDVASMWNVRPSTQISKITLFIEGNLPILQVLDQLYLIWIFLFCKIIQRLSLRYRRSIESVFLLSQLQHLLFYLLKVRRCKYCITRIYIIIEAILYRWTDAKLDIRVQGF